MMPTFDTLKPLIEAIHASSPQLCYRFAGAGTQALFWLHAVGGSSRTVLEATDHYTPASLIEALGFEPKRFTSKRVAQRLAQVARDRARTLAPGQPVFGLACTATIATDRTKRGDHRCVVAVTDTLGTISYELTLSKGARDRAGEEALVSLLVLKAVADASGVLDGPVLPLREDERLELELEPDPAIEQLAQGEVCFVKIMPNGRLEAGTSLADIAFLSGSFNPLHQGHKALARAAAAQLGREVMFELPLINAAKAEIDLLEARRRAMQFSGLAPVLLSRAALFVDKLTCFPNATFVVGADTAARLVAPRFYNHDSAEMDAALARLAKSGARFLVAGRQQNEDFLTLNELAIPKAYRHLFEAIPASAFNMDISSTELRRKWQSETVSQ